ncbi:hypothetical protein M8818_002588 [Zalaria obscura]|uniref:Uncharacterized protein n=1 Tax=Zalaria obscura TaxID=2024903 RepID=A0ACC3SJF2_9PEZI
MPAGIIPADYGEPKPSQLLLPQWTRYDFDFPFDNPPPGNNDRRRIPRRAGDPDTDHTSFVPNQATWGLYNMPPAAAMQELFKGGRGRQNGEVQTMIDAAGNEIVKHGKKVKSLEHILPACIDTKVSDWLLHCFHAQEPRIVWNDIVARMDQKVGTTALSNRGQRFESVHGILARNVKLPDCQHPEMGVVEDSLDVTKTPVERTHAQLRHEFNINKLFHFDLAPPVPAPYPVPGFQAVATAPRVPVVSSGTHPRNYFAPASTTAPPAVQAQHPIPGVQALPTAPRVPAVSSGTHHPENYFALASSTADPFVSAASNVNAPLSAVQGAQSANNVDTAPLGTRQRAVSNRGNGSFYAPSASPSSSGTTLPSTSPDSTGLFETDRQTTEAANRDRGDISSAPARYPVPPLQNSIQEVYTGVPGVQPLYSSDEESPNTPSQEAVSPVDFGQRREQEREFLFNQELQFDLEGVLEDPNAGWNNDKAKRTAEEADVEDSGSSKRLRSTSVAAPANTTQIASPPHPPPVTTSHTGGATPFVDLFAFEEFEDDSSVVAANSLTAPEVFSSDANGSEDSSDWCGDVLWKQYQL